MTIAGLVPAAHAVTVASEPYPWPYHGSLEPGHTALVVLLGPAWPSSGWWPGLSGDKVGTPAARMGAIARLLAGAGGAVVMVSTSLPAGAIPAAGPRESGSPMSCHYVQCAGRSGFYGSSLDAVLRRLGATDLVLCGWGLEGPVHSTLRSANDRGYECLLVPDASVAADQSLVSPACGMVSMSGGIFGAFAPTGAVIEALGRLAPPPGQPFAQAADQAKERL